MSGNHEQAMAEQLRNHVQAAVAEINAEERVVVRLVADTVRSAITSCEEQHPGLGHLALAVASIEFQQPPATDAVAETSTSSVGAEAGMTAFELNGAIRREIVTMLGCVGRKQLADRAAVEPLVDVIGMLFTEIADLDGDAQDAPKLRSRVAELEQLMSDTHGPMQAQIAELNRRIVALNREADAQAAGSAA